MSISVETYVAAFEYLLVLAGLGFLCWYAFSKAGRTYRTRPPALPFWRVTPFELLILAWLIFVFGLVGQVLLRVTVGPSLHRLPDGAMIEVVVYGSTFHFGAILTCVLAWAYHARRPDPAAAPAAAAPRGSATAVIRGALWTFLVAMPLLTAASLLWEPVLRAVGLPTERQELVDFLVNAQSPLSLLPVSALALVVAPVAEELVLRGGVFRYLRSRPPLAVVAGTTAAGAVALLGGAGLVHLQRGAAGSAAIFLLSAGAIGAASILSVLSPWVRNQLGRDTPRWVAYAVSAGLFALAHANWISFLPLFILGLLFASAYERTGRIAVPMLAHALFNLNSLVLVLSGVGS